MHRLAAALAAGALLGLAWTGVAQAACRMVKVGELPVRFEHNEPMVQMGLNGRPVWMLVDTGAASSLIFGGAARALGLNVVSATGLRFYGVGGGQDALTTVVRQVTLPGVSAHDLRFFVIGAEGGLEEAGVIGRDLLDSWDLEFDLAAKVVRLWTPQGCGDSILAYWTRDPDVADLRQDGRGDAYLVAVALDGRNEQAVLDSGAQITTVTPDAAHRARVAASDYGATTSSVHGVGETMVTTRLATFSTIQIGAETVKSTRLHVADMFARDTAMSTGSMLAHPVEGLRPPAMLMGADFLRAHRVLLAREQHRMYFTYSGGPVFDAPRAAAPAEAAPQTSPRIPPAQ